MFIRYYVEVGLPAGAVEATVLGLSAAWLPGLARDASAHGEALLATAGIDVPAQGPDRDVEVELGLPVRFPSKLVLPMVWRPVAGGRLLPALDADVEIGPLSPERTQLAISGSYVMPAAVAAKVADRLLLHRVAEATVKRFLDALGGQVTAGGAFPVESRLDGLPAVER